MKKTHLIPNELIEQAISERKQVIEGIFELKSAVSELTLKLHVKVCELDEILNQFGYKNTYEMVRDLRAVQEARKKVLQDKIQKELSE